MTFVKLSQLFDIYMNLFDETFVMNCIKWIILNSKVSWQSFFDMSLSIYFREPTYNSPRVEFNPESGILELKGKSIPENATQLYEPVLKWLKEYINIAPEETNLHINLDYFNTASSIWIARIIKVLASIDGHEKLLIIHLYFDIEEFDEMEEEDTKEAISPVTDVLTIAKLSVGVKIYAKDNSGTIIKEKLVLL